VYNSVESDELKQSDKAYKDLSNSSSNALNSLNTFLKSYQHRISNQRRINNINNRRFKLINNKLNTTTVKLNSLNNNMSVYYTDIINEFNKINSNLNIKNKTIDVN